jgi:hypothetical protein
VTVLVTDLGLELRGVPQSYVDAAQRQLDTGGLLPSRVRASLRPYCGPGQDEAEEHALARIVLHVPEDADGWCRACQTQLPCPVVDNDVRVTGAHLVLDEERR